MLMGGTTSEDFLLLTKGCGSGNACSSSRTTKAFGDNGVHLGKSKLDASNVMSMDEMTSFHVIYCNQVPTMDANMDFEVFKRYVFGIHDLRSSPDFSNICKALAANYVRNAGLFSNRYDLTFSSIHDRRTLVHFTCYLSVDTARYLYGLGGLLSNRYVFTFLSIHCLRSSPDFV